MQYRGYEDLFSGTLVDCDQERGVRLALYSNFRIQRWEYLPGLCPHTTGRLGKGCREHTMASTYENQP